MYFYFSKFLAPILNFTNFLIFFLILAYFFKKKKIFNILFCFFLFIGFFPIGTLFEFEFLSKNFYNKINSNDYDSVLILAGEEKRILHGLKLYKNKPNVKIFFSGGSGYLVEKNFQDERSYFIYLTKDSINPKDLIILKKSRNTFENIETFYIERKKFNLKKTILVTSPYHYKRALEICKKFNLDLLIYKWPNDPEAPKGFLQFYQRFNFAENLNIFNRFIREILGIFSVKIFL